MEISTLVSVAMDLINLHKKVVFEEISWPEISNIFVTNNRKLARTGFLPKCRLRSGLKVKIRYYRRILRYRVRY